MFDSTEVTNERGVVREEWRLGKGAGDRMLHQWLPIALQGSLYADRLPIGNEPSIMSATPSRLRAFYKDWYRPDLQAIIAVGDFNPDSIEAEIKRHFGNLPMPANAPARTLAGVPDNKEPLIAIASDKEATGSDVDLIFKQPTEKTKTVGDFRRDLMERLYLGMLNARFAEIAQKPDAPFLGASASRGSFVGRTTDAFTLAADVKDGAIPRGLEALLTEAKRVDEYGFLQSELDRAKEDILRGYEQAYAERDKTQSAAFVDDYIDNYLNGNAIPGIAYEYTLAKELIPQITLADVNKMASSWITDDNRIILAESPQKDSVKIPTRAELLAVFDQAAKAPVKAYTETLSSNPLIEHEPTPGRVVADSTIPSIGVTEWRLSNGARVLVKPTDFKADEVVFSSYRMGGTSLASDPDYMSATLASQVVGVSGLGGFNAVDLQKKLAGKAAAVAATIGDVSEEISGHASPKDLETMFQLIYLDFTAPRLDTAAFKAFANQVQPYLANRGSDPGSVFGDTVSWTMSQHDFRERPLSLATFSEVNPQKSLAFFKDRFADASDFTFVFVGNVDLATLKPLVEKYLASLPSLHRHETYRVVDKGPPTGIIEKVVHKGTEPKANTVLEFTGACESTPANRLALLALNEVVQIKLDETLREQLGGTYSPSVGGACSKVPRPEYTISIQFSSSPENADKLTKAVFAIIDTLQTKGPSAGDVEKVREQIARSREVSLKQNGYWLANILGREEAGEDPAGLAAPYDKMVSRLTAAEIQAAAKQYFNTKNYARFVLLPETAKPTP